MHGISMMRRTRRGKCFKSQIDTFVNSDIFKNEHGLELSDVNVYANVQSNPEMANRVRELMIVKDIQGFDESIPDDKVFESLEQKYSSTSEALQAVKARIADIRTAQLAEKRYQEYLEEFKRQGHDEP